MKLGVGRILLCLALLRVSAGPEKCLDFSGPGAGKVVLKY